MLIQFLCIRSKYTLRSVSNFHFHFQNLHLYSTSSPIQIPKPPNQSYTNCFIDHLGFSHEHALSASNKLRSKYVDYSKFSNNANSVVDCLKQHHFDDAHIVKVVSSFPQILAANVDQTLKPKIKFFQDRGFSGSDLVTLMSWSRSCFDRNMDVDHLDDLRAILGSNENILKFIGRAHRYFAIFSIKSLISNIALLNNEYGVDIDLSLISKSGFLMTELGYKPDYLTTHYVLLTYSLEKRMAPRHKVLLVLKEKGLLDYNFCTAFRKTEAQFLKVLIEPYKEAAPGLLELYQNNKGYSNMDAISRHQ